MKCTCHGLRSLKVLRIGGLHQVFRGLERLLRRSEHSLYNSEDLSLSPSRLVERWAMGVHIPESSVLLEAGGSNHTLWIFWGKFSFHTESQDMAGLTVCLLPERRPE